MEYRQLSLARFIKGYYRSLILVMAHFDSLTKLQDCPLLTFGVIDKIKTILIVYRWSKLTNQELITSNTSIQGYKIAYKKENIADFLVTFTTKSPKVNMLRRICKSQPQICSIRIICILTAFHRWPQLKVHMITIFSFKKYLIFDITLFQKSKMITSKLFQLGLLVSIMRTSNR